MLAIQTKYIGPTNFRGSRVKAAVMESKHNGQSIRQLTIGWDDALSPAENHHAAAVALIRKLGWTADNRYGDWVVGASEPGYVFVCDTKHGGDRITVTQNGNKP